MKTKTAFSTKLVELRKSKNLSQSEFGKIVGIKRHNIAAYEEGRAQPLVTTFLEICSQFKINPNFFQNETKD